QPQRQDVVRPARTPASPDPPATALPVAAVNAVPLFSSGVSSSAPRAVVTYAPPGTSASRPPASPQPSATASRLLSVRPKHGRTTQYLALTPGAASTGRSRGGVQGDAEAGPVQGRGRPAGSRHHGRRRWGCERGVPRPPEDAGFQ